MAVPGEDLQMELAGKEKIVEQLKFMIVEKEDIIKKTQSTLQETKASLSKAKLQSKAKIAKLTNQLEEAKKAALPDNASDKSSECGDDTPGEQANRGKIKLLRRKLADKDRQLTEKDDLLASQGQQIVTKEKVLEERERVIVQFKGMVDIMKNQLVERDKIIMDMNETEGAAPTSQETIDQIYPQILYKDKKIVDLNNSILELDRKIIDLQEFVNEKNEVIKGRDKVIGVLQVSIVEKDQNVTSQNALISKLTNRVESEEENQSLLMEKLEKAEHSLKVESERFNLRLTETQKYFEETLSDREAEISQLRLVIQEKDKDLVTRDNDLQELLLRHERDMKDLISKGEEGMQEQMMKMMEQKLKDINEVLNGKIQIIEVLTNDMADRDCQLLAVNNTLKSLKEKLAVSSEQNLLQQQSFVDFEMSWKNEKQKLEDRLRALIEKHEEEKGEMSLQLHTLQVSLKQYEAAYSQAALQYNALQERYTQAYTEVMTLKSSATMEDNTVSAGATAKDSNVSADQTELLKQLQAESDHRKTLEEQLELQQKQLEELKLQLQQQQHTEKPVDRHKSPVKTVDGDKSEETSTHSSKSRDKQKSTADSPAKSSDAKILKVRAQFTAKIKTLEKEIEQLKKGNQGSDEVETLKNHLAEVEEEKGNLLLQLVDFDDTKALQGQLEQQLAESEKRGETLQWNLEQLELQLQEVQHETYQFREKASRLEEEEKQKLSQLECGENLNQKDGERLAELQQKCTELTVSLQEETEQCVKLQADLTVTEAEIAEQRGQVLASNAAIEELQKNLVERSEQVFKLEGEKVGLEVQAAELEEIRNSLENDKAQLQQQIETLNINIEYEKQPNIVCEEEEVEENTKLQLTIQELQDKLVKQEGLTKKQKEEINQLIPKLQFLEEEQTQFLMEAERLNQELLVLRKSKEETEVLLQKTNILLDGSESRQQQTESSLNTAISEQERARKELQQRLDETLVNFKQQTVEIGDICKFLNVSDISIQQLSHTVRDKLSYISELQTKLQKAEHIESEKNNILDTKEAELEMLRSQIQNYKKKIELSMQDIVVECDSYKENLLTKDQTIQLLQETVESQNAEMQKFHQLQKARDEILSSLEQKAEQYEIEALERTKEFSSKYQVQQSQIETLQKEVEAKQQNLLESGSKMNALKKSLQDKVEEVKNLSSKHAIASSNTERLLSEKEQQLEKLKSGLEKTTKVLNEKQTEFDQKLNQTNSVISKLELENSEKDIQIENLSQNVSELSEKYNETARLCEHLQSEKEAQIKPLQEYTVSVEVVKDLLINKLGIPPSSAEMATSLSGHLKYVAAQVQELQTDKSQLESVLQDSNKKNEMLQVTVAELESLCSEKDFSLLNTKSDSSQQELTLKKLIEERDIKICSLQENLEILNLDLQQNKIKEEELRTQLKNLEKTSCLMQSQLDDANSHVEALLQQQTRLEEQIRDLKDRENCFGTKQAALESSLAEQDQKVRLLSENLELALHERESMNAEMINVRNEVMCVTNSNLELTKDVGQLGQLLSVKEESVDCLSCELESERSQARAQLEKCCSQIKELEETSVTLNSKLSESSSTKKSLENQLDQTRNQKVQLQEERNQLVENSDELMSRVAEWETKHSSLYEEQNTLLKDRNDIAEKLVNAELLASEKNSTIESFRTSLGITQDELKNVSVELQETLTHKKHFEENSKELNTKLETDAKYRSTIEAENMQMKQAFEEYKHKMVREFQEQCKMLESSYEVTKKQQEDILSLTNELKVLHSSVDSQLADRSSSILVLEEQLQEFNQKRNELNKEIELLQLEKQEADMDIHNFKVTLQEKEELIKNLILSLDEAKDLKTHSDDKLRVLTEGNEFNIETLKNLNNEVLSYQNTIISLESELSGIKDEKAGKEESLDEMQICLKERDATLEDYIKICKSLEVDNDSINLKVKEAKDLLEQKDSEIARIQRMLSDSQHEKEEFLFKFSNESQVAIELKNQNKNLSNKLEIVRDQVKLLNETQEIVKTLKLELKQQSEESIRLKYIVTIAENDWYEMNNVIDTCMNSSSSSSSIGHDASSVVMVHTADEKKTVKDQPASSKKKKKKSSRKLLEEPQNITSHNSTDIVSDLSQCKAEVDTPFKLECDGKVLVKKVKDLVSERESLLLVLESLPFETGRESPQNQTILTQVEQLQKLLTIQKHTMERQEQVMAEKKSNMDLVEGKLLDIYTDIVGLLASSLGEDGLQDANNAGLSGESQKKELEVVVSKFSNLFLYAQVWKESRDKELYERLEELSAASFRAENLELELHEFQLANNNLVLEKQNLEKTIGCEKSLRMEVDKELKIAQESRNDSTENLRAIHNCILRFIEKSKMNELSAAVPVAFGIEDIKDILEATFDVLFDRIELVAGESIKLKSSMNVLEESSIEQVAKLEGETRNLTGKLREIKSEMEKEGQDKLLMVERVTSLQFQLAEIEDEKVQLEGRLGKVVEEREQLEDKLGKVVEEREQLKDRLGKVVEKKEQLEGMLDKIVEEKEQMEVMLSKVDETEQLEDRLCKMVEEKEQLKASLSKVRENFDKSLQEKDIVAEQLAKVDLELVSTVQEKVKLRTHLDQLLRDHSKCTDIEPRLEKALKDKQVLSQKLLDVENKLSQVITDKNRLGKQLTEMKLRINKPSLTNKRRPKVQEVAANKRDRKSQEDSKRKNSLTKKDNEKELSDMLPIRERNLESAETEISRESSPTLSENSNASQLSDSYLPEAFEQSLKEEILALRSKSEEYSNIFEDLKDFWTKTICKMVENLILPGGNINLGEFRPEEIMEEKEQEEDSRSFVVKVENLKTSMLDCVTRVEHWKMSLVEYRKTNESILEEKHQEPKKCHKQQEVMNTKTKELEKSRESGPVVSNDYTALCDKNERLKQVCIKLKKSCLQKTAEVAQMKSQLESAKTETLQISQQLQLLTDQREENLKVNHLEQTVVKLKEDLDLKISEMNNFEASSKAIESSLKDSINQLDTSISVKDQELNALRDIYSITKNSFSLLTNDIFEMVLVKESNKPKVDSLKRLMDEVWKELDPSVFQNVEESNRKDLKILEASHILKDLLNGFHRYQHEISAMVLSFMSCLRDIQKDIEEKTIKTGLNAKQSILDDLKNIIDSSDYLDNFGLTEASSDCDNTKLEMCLLNDADTQSGLDFLKWLRTYITSLLVQQTDDHKRALDIVSELNAVVTSKEKTIQNMTDTIESLSAERKRLAEEVACLKNACDDGNSKIMSRSDELKKMKNTIDAIGNGIFDVLTSVKNAYNSPLSTIMEEDEEEGEEEYDNVDGNELQLPGSQQLRSLQYLRKHVTSLLSAYSQATSLCTAQNREILNLNSLLQYHQEQTQSSKDADGSVHTPSEGKCEDHVYKDNQSCTSTEQLMTRDSVDGKDATKDMSSEFDEKCRELQLAIEEKDEVDQQLDMAQNRINQLETEVTALVETKVEMQSYLKNLQDDHSSAQSQLGMARGHLQQMQDLSLQFQKKSIQVEELSSLLQSAEAKLNFANQSLTEKEASIIELKELLKVSNMQQATRCSSDKEEMALLKEQLNTREQQLQNLTIEMAKNMVTNEELQTKLSKKDEKVMSLLENMQELEEQLTASCSLKEDNEANLEEMTKLKVEHQKGMEALEVTKKCLQNKENQYLKILATAKKLKLQGQEAKNETSNLQEQLKEMQRKMNDEMHILHLVFEKSQNQVVSEWPELNTTSTFETDPNIVKALDSTTDLSSFSEYGQRMLLLQQNLTGRLQMAKQLVSVKQQEIHSLQVLSEEREVLLSDLKHKLGLLASQNVDKEALVGTIAEKDHQMLNLQDRIHELDNKLKHAETETEKNVRISFLNDQLDEAGKKIHLFQQEISKREQKLQESQLMGTRLEENVEEFSNQLQQAQELREQEHLRLESMTLQMEDLSLQFKNKSTQVEELSSLLQAAEEQLNFINQSLKEKEASIFELKELLEMSRKENEHSVQEVRELKDLYNKTLSDLQQGQADLNNKETQLKATQAQLEHLGCEFQQKDLLIQEFKDKIEQYQSSIKTDEALNEVQPKLHPEAEGNPDDDIAESLEPNLSLLYERLKLESIEISSEKEHLASRNNELSSLWKEAKDKANQLATEQQGRDLTVKTLEENLNESHRNLTKLEEEVEELTEKLSESVKEKKLLSVKVQQLNSERGSVEDQQSYTVSDQCSGQVPFAESIVKEHQETLPHVKVEKEAIQRSGIESVQVNLSSSERELQNVKERYETLSEENSQLKNKYQIMKEKCEKLLAKLKSFKDKNDNLQKQMEKMKTLKQDQETEAITQLKGELDSERVRCHHLSALIQTEQGNTLQAKERIHQLKNKLQEIENQKEKYANSYSELQSKCKTLSEQLGQTRAEKRALEDSMDQLRNDNKSVIKELKNEHLVEKSSLLNKISNLEAECKTVYADLEDFQQLVKKQKEVQDSLKSENQKMKENILRLETVLANGRLADGNVEQMEMEFLGLREERDSLRDLIEVAREEAMLNKKESQMLYQKFEEVSDNLKEHQLLVAELGNTKTELEKKGKSHESLKKHLERKLAATEKDLEGMREELSQVKDENQMLTEKLIDVTYEIKEYKTATENIEAMNKELEDHRTRQAQMVQGKIQLELNLSTVEMELQRSQVESEQNVKQIDLLSEEVRLAFSDSESLKRNLESVEIEVSHKEQSLLLFKSEVDLLNEQIQSLTSQCRDLESTRQAVTILKKENNGLAKEVRQLGTQNEELLASKEELAVVSERYNNLLLDNTNLVKQIEELHSKLQLLSQVEKERSFAHEQREHLEREQMTFTKRVEELEELVQDLTNQNTQLKQDMVQVNSALKQAHFDNESFKSQLQVVQSGGDRLSQFQVEYEKLQQQFAKSVEQNNSVQAELNQANHRLQLREARCQQLAMQVSQLAEDRSYLNVQMGNLSLALREKEKEATNVARQCKNWYEKQNQLQQRVTELETSRADALKLYESYQNQGSQLSSEDEDSLRTRIAELEQHQEELMETSIEQATRFSAEREQRLQAEINFQQLQQQLNIIKEQSTQDFKLQLDDDHNRVIEAEPLLIRHGTNHFQRLQRWAKVKKHRVAALYVQHISSQWPWEAMFGACRSRELTSFEEAAPTHVTLRKAQDREYLSFSSRLFQRLLRIRPNLRTLIWFYFLLLHGIILGCLAGFF